MPGKVSGQWIVKGTRILADGVLENADAGYMPEQLAGEIYEGLPVESVAAPCCPSQRGSVSRILLDQNVPFGIPRLLPGHEVSTAYRMGWAALLNGDLLRAAEAAGFEVMITCDQNIGYQQNLAARKIALVALEANNWDVIRKNAVAVLDAVSRSRPGRDEEIGFPLPPLRRAGPGRHALNRRPDFKL